MSDDDRLGIKVTLIGESSVGKTCIINYYCKENPDLEVDATLGANYSQKKIERNGVKIRLDLWDTAGQEKYRAIGRHFYKESYIVCLVYDITSRESFENLKEIWYPELMEYGENLKIIALVGNKVDLYLDEKVKEEEGRKFAKEINAVFKRTSALNGTEINELFDELVDKYLFEIKGDISKEEKAKKKEDNIMIKNENNIEKKKKKKFC